MKAVESNHDFCNTRVIEKAAGFMFCVFNTKSKKNAIQRDCIVCNNRNIEKAENMIFLERKLVKVIMMFAILQLLGMLLRDSMF